MNKEILNNKQQHELKMLLNIRMCVCRSEYTTFHSVFSIFMLLNEHKSCISDITETGFLQRQG